MNLFRNFVLKYIPLIASISLWVYYFLNQEGLVVVLLVSAYSILLYLTSSRKTNEIDGVIEVSEDEIGKKTFQLIIDKDPESFQDQDQVVFMFKDAS